MHASGEEVVLVARGKTDQDDGSQLETSAAGLSAENLVLNLKGGELAATAGSESVLLARLKYAFASTDMGPPPPTPLHRVFGKLAVCTLAGLSRDVPRQIFFSLLHTLCSRLDGEESTQLLRTSSLGNVQVLLLLGLNSELQAVTTSRGGSLSWLTVGLAVRMAQDIGLHRDITSNHVAQQQVNRRRRVWAACVIADRWYALSFGQPMTINLYDCDARGPSIFPDACADGLSETEKPFELHAEITKLSILLGRVLRYAYSPLGLDMVTNSTLYQLQEDFEQWRSDLPPTLHFSPEQPDPRAGLLGLLSACVEFVFLRAFLRPKKPIPTRISYRPSVDAWQHVVKRSEHAIRWIAAGGSFFMDTWFIVMYSHMWCFFVQLHAYVATGDAQALGLMQTANDSISQWAQRMKSLSNQAALRTKVASLANTLTVAALSSHQRRGGQGVAQTTNLPPEPAPDTHNVSLSSADPNPGPKNQAANIFDEIFPPLNDTLAPDMQLLELFLHDPQLGWAFQPDGMNVEPAIQNFDEIDRFYMLD
ncbi:hypothetical protein EHS25_000909 [Saitozyma podzolica]|uniref:Xylanolytic transcriptional activator regulatory domain-containing protein n=1 Tax=Saitozyma podzolica TaxID=1890683 RepID=A0A427YXK8_9TREE|nr:hypothetical protein EHS25_000909 [Saitozyma podzolica]